MRPIPGTDALGRRRHAAQHRGLRPLFPKLPADCRSRLLRIAMSGDAWDRFEALVKQAAAATRPRAVGQTLERLLRAEVAATAPVGDVGLSAVPPEARGKPGDWQEWQIQKELALLATAGGGVHRPPSSHSRSPSF
jgi:hypothetical protein